MPTDTQFELHLTMREPTCDLQIVIIYGIFIERIELYFLHELIKAALLTNFRERYFRKASLRRPQLLHGNFEEMFQSAMNLKASAKTKVKVRSFKPNWTSMIAV